MLNSSLWYGRFSTRRFTPKSFAFSSSSDMSRFSIMRSGKNMSSPMGLYGWRIMFSMFMVCAKEMCSFIVFTESFLQFSFVAPRFTSNIGAWYVYLRLWVESMSLNSFRLMSFMLWGSRIDSSTYFSLCISAKSIAVCWVRNSFSFSVR